MSLDINETQIQLSIVQKLFPENNFLQKLFFPNSGASISNTIKIKKAQFTRRIAHQVASANSAHTQVTYPNSSELDVNPPYIKEEYAVDNEALKTVSNTTGINVGKSPGEIARDKRTSMLIDMKNSVYRRVEQMCSQLLYSGKVTLDNNTDITYDYPGTHTVTNSDAEKWDASNVDIIEQLREWKRLITKDSGVAPTTAVLGNKAHTAFLNYAKSNELFNSLKINIGNIDTRLEAKMGAIYIGRINELALDLWAYDGSYAVGANQIFYVPEGKIIMGSKNPHIASLEWGAINRADVNGAIEIFTGVWNDDKLGRVSQLLEARPLPVYKNPEAFLNAKVV